MMIILIIITITNQNKVMDRHRVQAEEAWEEREKKVRRRLNGIMNIVYT